ncbi:TPA: hypothetical protein DCZ46_02230 [Candidatus Campbellbacteria bacterium]|uniref:NERD domain-containing protein n=1 Tax=Candidatus Nomurabacteria bacterium GW2011_GWC2_42_20 TaxID=1618756 RepID=A0A0G0ZHX7_9BACT|nr:MAG: hypothetical protein UU88_C0003G0005 [Parcubacteria group bacterium GW2011_GWC1_42_11]KKS48340.1 MAG: hypothetical protein UV12_C0001G0035 [Candidatus Nomurabacteria bacterium GW2011_GWC2_42_20]KKT09916.1 MAG: hypothetical protein UV86_C0001G0018 [Candidatus Nomurabacteria bacterium GW2011_GWB1_43_20]TAN35586.1 MAG: NERD domain-containing protein [Patescibacteria group bacterium]HBC70755.1 hypothetical protein [Candidatus Campbellbacteria bacterium]
MEKLSYSKKLYYKAGVKLLIFPILAMILGISFFVYGIDNAIALGVPLAGLVGFGLGFILFPLSERVQTIFDKKIDHIYSKYADPIIDDRDAAKRGIDGESIVFGWLNEILTDKSWSIYKNVEFTAGDKNKFDIDAIVVGPKGIFVFEIKNLSYDFFFTSHDCDVVVGEQIRPCSQKDPRIQIAQNAEILEKKLKASGFNGVKTKRAVVFARPESIRFLGSTTVFLIDNKETLKRYMLEQYDDLRFTPEFCEKVKEAILS